MRPSLFIVTLTLTATTWGCASTGTTATTVSSSTTVGLKSLDGDVVLSGTTPEVTEGTLHVDRQTVASSGLWMETSSRDPDENSWQQPTPRLDRMYKLVTPPASDEAPKDVAYLRDRRSARQ
jgi:hypothetical protein